MDKRVYDLPGRRVQPVQSGYGTDLYFINSKQDAAGRVHVIRGAGGRGGGGSKPLKKWFLDPDRFHRPLYGDYIWEILKNNQF